jgi:hypothetical protein
MTYLPQRAFNNILSFCDDRLETNQKINHKKVMAVIDYMRITCEITENLRENLEGSEETQFLIWGRDANLLDDFSKFFLDNPNTDISHYLNLMDYAFGLADI